MKIKTDCMGRTEDYYTSDAEFMLHYTPYEFDELSGRYYYLEPSVSLTSRAGREGALVRRRISKADYEKALAECKTRFAETFDDVPDKPRKALTETTAADSLRYRADRIEGKTDTIGAFVPRISGKDMAADLDKRLRREIDSRHYPTTNPMTAAYEFYGYTLALEELGILDEQDVIVALDRFAPESRRAFEYLPGDKKQSSTAREVYALGRILEMECPDDDCRVYLNVFRMCRELDEQAERLSGFPRQVVERELRKEYLELERMFCFNHAVKKFRRGLRT